jgi:hypothetical protein
MTLSHPSQSLSLLKRIKKEKTLVVADAVSKEVRIKEYHSRIENVKCEHAFVRCMSAGRRICVYGPMILTSDAFLGLDLQCSSASRVQS